MGTKKYCKTKEEESGMQSDIYLAFKRELSKDVTKNLRSQEDKLEFA